MIMRTIAARPTKIINLYWFAFEEFDMDEISGNRVASRLITHRQPGIITLGNTSNNLIQNDKLDRKMGINGCLHCGFFLTSVTES